MNPLNDYPAVRKIAYHFQWLVNGFLTIAGVVFAATSTGLDALPEWYVITLAVAPALWAYLGLTAQANVPSFEDVAEGKADPPEEGDVGVLEALLIVLLVVVLIVLLGGIR